MIASLICSKNGTGINQYRHKSSINRQSQQLEQQSTNIIERHLAGELLEYGLLLLGIEYRYRLAELDAWNASNNNDAEPGSMLTIDMALLHRDALIDEARQRVDGVVPLLDELVQLGDLSSRGAINDDNGQTPTFIWDSWSSALPLAATVTSPCSLLPTAASRLSITFSWGLLRRLVFAVSRSSASTRPLFGQSLTTFDSLTLSSPSACSRTSNRLSRSAVCHSTG